MRPALLIAYHFDKADRRVLDIRSAMRSAGYEVKCLAVAATPDNQRDDETIYLRARALGFLMFASQLIIAGVITGYFLTFLPVLMTVIFWALIFNAIFFVSRWGANYRERILGVLITFLARFETGKQKPDMVFSADAESHALAERLARRDGARLVDDVNAIPE